MKSTGFMYSFLFIQPHHVSQPSNDDDFYQRSFNESKWYWYCCLGDMYLGWLYGGYLGDGNNVFDVKFLPVTKRNKTFKFFYIYVNS